MPPRQKSRPRAIKGKAISWGGMKVIQTVDRVHVVERRFLTFSAPRQSSNLQIPSSKEIPSTNNQKPSTARTPFGAWDLELLWSLVLGTWDFLTGCAGQLNV